MTPELAGTRLATMATQVQIIIVNWNTGRVLADCLASLPAATRGLVARTTVVDNGSSDGSAAMIRARFPDIAVIEAGQNLGFARANNRALARATEGDVLLLNPDTVCPPASLSRLHQFLHALPDAAAVGPALVDGEGRPTAAFGDFPRRWHHLVGCLGPLLPSRQRDVGLGRVVAPVTTDAIASAVAVDYIKGACLLIRREALATVGELDEAFFLYFEETDWCRRAAARGLRVYVCPGVVVVHLEGQVAEQASAFSRRQFEASYRTYIAKHLGPRAVAGFRAAQFVEHVAKGIRRSVTPTNRKLNGQRARAHFARARLQLVGDVTSDRR